MFAYLIIGVQTTFKCFYFNLFGIDYASNGYDTTFLKTLTEICVCRLTLLFVFVGAQRIMDSDRSQSFDVFIFRNIDIEFWMQMIIVAIWFFLFALSRGFSNCRSPSDNFLCFFNLWRIISDQFVSFLKSILSLHHLVNNSSKIVDELGRIFVRMYIIKPLCPTV